MPRMVESEISLTTRLLKLKFFEHELISIEGVEHELMCTRQEIEGLPRKPKDQESKKKELVKEMNNVLKERDKQLNEKDEEIAELRKQNQELIQHIQFLERQRSRKIRKRKSRAEVAFGFVKSYGLKLTYLKGVDCKILNTRTHAQLNLTTTNLHPLQTMKTMRRWSRFFIYWTSFVRMMNSILR